MAYPRRCYIDTNIVLAAIRCESPDAALPKLAQHARKMRVPLVTSTLTRIEIRRILIREGIPISPSVTSVFEGFDIVRFTEDIGELAARLPVMCLKTLDAIHLATAIMTDCDAVITQDRQLINACTELGLATTM
jgi:predicted nucleic acid-binding protein